MRAASAGSARTQPSTIAPAMLPAPSIPITVPAMARMLRGAPVAAPHAAPLVASLRPSGGPCTVGATCTLGRGRAAAMRRGHLDERGMGDGNKRPARPAGTPIR